jgi:phage replication O-like protein O
MEALAKYKIPTEPMRVLLHILRMTYGYNRKEAQIDLDGFVKHTSLIKSNICRALKWLLNHRVIIKDDNYRPPKYSFNKHFTKWRVIINADNALSKPIKNVINADNNGGSTPIIFKTNKQYNVEHAKIVAYLNEKANTNFRHTSKVTRRHIKARWNEGFRLDDFQKVIDVKCGQWKNNADMVAYLRPQTLFGTKFESYLNEHKSNKHYEKPLTEEQRWLKSQGKL